MENGYRQLMVWRAGMSLVEATYAPTRRLPDDQRYGLTSQIQRAGVSIPSNIAEGHAKRQSKDYARHLRIAAGSLADWETQAELIVRLGFADREDVRTAWDNPKTRPGCSAP